MITKCSICNIYIYTQIYTYIWVMSRKSLIASTLEPLTKAAVLLPVLYRPYNSLFWITHSSRKKEEGSWDSGNTPYIPAEAEPSKTHQVPFPVWGDCDQRSCGIKGKPLSERTSGAACRLWRELWGWSFHKWAPMLVWLFSDTVAYESAPVSNPSPILLSTCLH